MKLENLLAQKRASIVKRWFDLVLETYPPDTSRFLKKQKDRFSNPVGYMILEGIEALYEELLRGADPERVSPFLDQIIRVRAIQDFTPSEAISFMYLLKKVIREELDDEIRGDRISPEELLTFESKIDELVLLSFNIYVKCREKVYEIQANQARNMAASLLERMNVASEIPEWEPDLKDDSDIK